MHTSITGSKKADSAAPAGARSAGTGSGDTDSSSSSGDTDDQRVARDSREQAQRGHAATQGAVQNPYRQHIVQGRQQCHGQCRQQRPALTIGGHRQTKADDGQVGTKRRLHEDALQRRRVPTPAAVNPGQAQGQAGPQHARQQVTGAAQVCVIYLGGTGKQHKRQAIVEGQARGGVDQPGRDQPEPAQQQAQKYPGEGRDRYGERTR